MIVPPSPGVLCALGDATTAKRSESARTVLRRLGADLTGADLATILRELADEAGGRLAEQGVTAAEQTTGYQVDVRYHGQGFEIGIPSTRAGWTTRTAALQQLAAPSTPSTSGCSPSCSAPTTSWSTPGPR